MIILKLIRENDVMATVLLFENKLMKKFWKNVKR